MYRPIICMSVGVAFEILISCVGAAIADEKDKLVGTWRFVEAVSEDLSTGQKTDIYQGTPVGFIMYSGDGRMMVMNVNSGRKRPAGAVAMTPEAEALFRSMTAYGGTYWIDGNRVIHHVDISWNETWTGTDQVREYKLEGERLPRRRRIRSQAQ